MEKIKYYQCPHIWEKKEQITILFNTGISTSVDISQQITGKYTIIKCILCGEERQI